MFTLRILTAVLALGAGAFPARADSANRSGLQTALAGANFDNAGFAQGNLEAGFIDSEVLSSLPQSAGTLVPGWPLDVDANATAALADLGEAVEASFVSPAFRSGKRHGASARPARAAPGEIETARISEMATLLVVGTTLLAIGSLRPRSFTA